MPTLFERAVHAPELVSGPAATSGAPIRVLIADDQSLIRRGLVAILNMEEGIEVVGEACDGLEALALWRQTQPDIVLMDLRMPGMGGLDAIRKLRAEAPAAAVIVLTTFDHDEDVYACLRAGARSYLLKDVQPEELFGCIRAIHAGQGYLQPKIAAKLVQRVGEEMPTEREVQILQLLALGKSNKAIGLDLHISESTVKSHLKSLFSKLDVTSRAEAIALAARRGFVHF